MHGGIFKSRTGEGKWEIISMEAKVDVLGIVRTSEREREKKRKKLKDPWRREQRTLGKR